MATVNRIASGDNDRYDEWNATAERVFAEAAQLAAGLRISARDGDLRATTYFRGSEVFFIAIPTIRASTAPIRNPSRPTNPAALSMIRPSYR